MTYNDVVNFLTAHQIEHNVDPVEAVDYARDTARIVFPGYGLSGTTDFSRVAYLIKMLESLRDKLLAAV